MTDEECKRLEQELEKLDVSELKALNVQLVQERTALEDLNSSYPATQEFLQARGLTNVRQLDAAGRAELVKHLEKTLADIFKTSS
jgi:hypothetical protein